MNLSQIHLCDIQVFLAVAESGSLVSTSRKLGINHSTVFRWLKRLEEQVGDKLFDRTNNRYVLSATGHSILPIAEKIATEITSLSMMADSLNSHLVGTVNVTSADALVLGYLPRVIKRFHAMYPGLTINLSANNDFADLSKREADVAIRPTHVPEGHMVGRKAASMAFGLYASNGYINEHGTPTLDDKGMGHRLCNYDRSLSHLNAARWLQDHMSNADTVVQLASTVSLTQFAIAGMGIAAIPCFLANAEPTLVKIMSLSEDTSSDIWIMTHPDLRHSPKVRAVLDFIFEDIRANESTFADTKPC